jgi:hypothetical protein
MKRKHIKLEKFVVTGADNDAPSHGFEVVESDLPSIPVGEFLLDSEVKDLREHGARVNIRRVD